MRPRHSGVRQWATSPESSQSQAGTAQFPKWLQWAMRGSESQTGSHVVGERPQQGSQSHEERQTVGYTPGDHPAGLQRRLVLGRETCSRKKTETWIGTPCRVRMVIYLIGYGGEGEKEDEQREAGQGEEAP